MTQTKYRRVRRDASQIVASAIIIATLIVIMAMATRYDAPQQHPCPSDDPRMAWVYGCER